MLASCVKEQVAKDQEFSFIKFSGQSANTTGQDVKQLSDGSYVAIGTTANGSNGTDMYLTKFDKYGTEIWHKTYGGKNDQTGNSLQVLSDGSLILVGNTQLTDSVSNIFLVKTDANGDTSSNAGWTKTIGGLKRSMWAYNIQVTNTGFIIAGSYDTLGFRNDQIVLSDFNGNNLFFGNGKYINISKYNEELSNAIELKGGGYLGIGYTNENGLSEMYLRYYSADFYSSMYKTFGASAIADSGKSVKQLSDGNFICTYDSGSIIRVMKFSFDSVSAGFTPIWVKSYGTTTASNDIQIVSGNEYAITGYQGNSSNTDNMLFMTIDGNGNKLNSQIYGVTGNQVGEKVIATKDGGFLIVGTNSTLGVSEMALVKTKKDGGL